MRLTSCQKALYVGTGTGIWAMYVHFVQLDTLRHVDCDPTALAQKA